MGYLVSVIPSLWILQFEQHYRVVEGQGNNPNCSESDASTDGILVNDFYCNYGCFVNDRNIPHFNKIALLN